MAEFVEFRAEDMLKELEQMERMKLFDKTEVKAIIKKRKDFEYKIQRRTKCKDNYLRYIHYEMDLLNTVATRREKVGNNQKKSDIEVAIASRLNRLFKEALYRFSEDVRLWLSYFKFCKRVRFFTCVSRILQHMTQIHPDKPILWKLAAKWEFEECHSVENARKFLLRGLRFHPDSKLLNTEAFRLELMYASMKRKEKEEKEAAEAAAAASKEGGTSEQGQETTSASTSLSNQMQGRPSDVPDKVIEGHLAEIVYESAVKKVQDVVFVISLLEIAKEFPFTEKLQKKIINDLLTRYPNEELTWDTMAKRMLAGLSYTPDHHSDATSPTDGSEAMEVGEENVKKETDGNSANKNSLKERIRQCCAVYLAGVKRLPTEKMWSRYIEAMLELNQDMSHLPTFKRNVLNSAFQGAHSAGKMQARYYLQWANILQNTGKIKKLEGVLRVATERLPANIELWQMRLRFHLARDEEELGLNVFRDVTSRLGPDSNAALPLWKIVISYCQTKSSYKTEQVFRDAIQQGPGISVPLKPLYLEWLVLTKGIVAARKVYEELSILPPFCWEMHSKMVALECMQPDINLKNVRRCYEIACTQFGKNNTDLWIEYVKFEQTQGDAKNVNEVYWRALKTLDPVHTDGFVSEFSLLKTGITAPLSSTL